MLPSSRASRASSARPLVGALPERRRGYGRDTLSLPAIDRRQRQIPSLRQRPRPPRPLDLLLSRRGVATTASPTPDSSASRTTDFVVRRATEEDWWHLSQVHCASFFPSTPKFLVPLFRLDRVLGIEAGVSSELKGRGRFACLVAVRVGGEQEDEEQRGEERESEAGTREERPVDAGPGLWPGETSAAAAAAAAAAPSSLPLSLLPRQLRGCFEPLAEGATRAGVLGAVCVDAQWCQLPPRRLAPKRNAAVAGFVALVSPGARREEGGGGPAAPAPPPPPSPPPPPPPPSPPSGRAPPGAVAYLSNLAVAPRARELGVGRALLAAAEREAWGWGCRSVALHVGRSNAAAAGLYLSSGFRAVGGALPLAAEQAATGGGGGGRGRPTAQQQLAGGPLTLMLKVAPREVLRERRAREAAAAAKSAASSSSSSPSSPPPSSSSSANSFR